MPWPDALVPARMARVAVVAPDTRWDRVLAHVADAGVVEPDGLGEGRDGDGSPAAAGDGKAGDGLAEVTGASVEQDGVRAVAGWMPSPALPALAARLEPLGGAVVELPPPAGQDPPTQFAGRAGGGWRVLVDTYATVPYRDVDPVWFAAAAYVVMFGMMFGDTGDGLLLVLAALWLRTTRSTGLAGFRRAWPMLAALGASAAVFGLLYGEAFGPTGLVPALWLRPLDRPTALLGAGIVVGAALLAVAYALGVVNRWREGGAAFALYSPSGVAGAALFAGLGLVAAGVWAHWGWLEAAGGFVAALALVLVAVGLKAGAGRGAAGGLQASVELVDVVIRLGSNVVSFARLAAFGLTHAALGQVVWDATTGWWHPSLTALAAVAVFVVGHVLAFTLEALVAGVQALRLEYYELFSRIFTGDGRPFHPWHVPLPALEES